MSSDDRPAPVYPPAVRLAGVTKAFGAVRVLDAIELDVPKGQRVAIIGPSGSGKTTLLRLLMTLERPDAGTIEIDGELLGMKRVGSRLVPDDERHLRLIRGKVGMVFQHFNLFPHMTAIQNVMEGPSQVLRLPRADAHTLAEEL